MQAVEVERDGHGIWESDVAHKFEMLRRRFLRADGEPWRDVEISRASNKRVSSSYISALRRGDLKRPGIEKLSTIADVMGFPLEMWLTEPEEWDAIPGSLPPEPLDEIVELSELEQAIMVAVRRLDPARQDAVRVLAEHLFVA